MHLFFRNLNFESILLMEWWQNWLNRISSATKWKLVCFLALKYFLFSVLFDVINYAFLVMLFVWKMEHCYSELVVELIPNRTSRSSDKHFLKQLPVRTEIARRAFSQAAPSVLNSLPAFFRSIKQFTEFKKCLKTHFFKLAYPDWSRDFFRVHNSLSA